MICFCTDVAHAVIRVWLIEIALPSPYSLFVNRKTALLSRLVFLWTRRCWEEKVFQEDYTDLVKLLQDISTDLLQLLQAVHRVFCLLVN